MFVVEPPSIRLTKVCPEAQIEESGPRKRTQKGTSPPRQPLFVGQDSDLASSIATGVGTHLRLCNLLFCKSLRCRFEFDCQQNGQLRAPSGNVSRQAAWRGTFCS